MKGILLKCKLWLAIYFCYKEQMIEIIWKSFKMFKYNYKYITCKPLKEEKV